MKELAPISQINRSIAPSYRAAAGDLLDWATERAFFEHQIAQIPDVMEGIQAGVPETIESVKQAARECASMGLSMSPNAALVYFIPRRKRRKRDNESWESYKAQVPVIVGASPSYRGLAYISTHYAGAELIVAEVVFKAEVDTGAFVYNGPLERCHHRPVLDPKMRGESNAVGVYATVIFKNGLVRTEYMDREMVLACRKMSERPKASMWTTVWTEGWKKTCIRRMSKLTMTSCQQMLAATTAMNQHEGAIFDTEEQKEEDPAGELLVSEEQCLELHAALTDRDIESERASDWLTKKAMAMGYNSIHALPARLFDEVKESLIERAAEWNRRIAGMQS